MKEKKKTIYKCDYCGKNLLVKSAMEHHEEFCGKNPDNLKKCNLCKHLNEAEIEYTTFYFNGYSETELHRKAKVFKCEKLNKLMYGLAAERRGLPDKYPETFAEQSPMPKECMSYDDGTT